MDICPRCGYDDTIKQQWKSLDITHGAYVVSDLGNFISYRIYSEGRLLKTVIGSHGYPLVGITLPDGERTTFTVHRLVMETFGGERPDGSFINHIDGVKTNTAFTNLEYVTPAGNSRHAVENDLMQHGVKRWNAKLTPEKVLVIRNTDESQEYLADKFSVSFGTIKDVQIGRTWKRVGGNIRLQKKRKFVSRS